MPGASVNMSETGSTSWYGKMPSAADFVGRRMPHAMETEWDSWVRSGLDQLRHEGGSNWHERFVRCPIWFFLLSGPTDGQVSIGAIAPSIDRMGRYYPMTVAAFSPTHPMNCADDAPVRSFLEGARSAIVDARRIPLTVDQFDKRISSLESPFLMVSHQPNLISEILGELNSASHHASGQSITMPGLDWRNLIGSGSGTSIWWISPTPQFQGELVVHHGPLHRPLFARLFKVATE